MFSGGDSSDGINSLNQFGAYGFVNQIAVSNAMAAGQNIDWAQLAQQWIQMRDNKELEAKTDSVTSANNKVGDNSCNNFKYEEKGEADMDMDDEEQPEEQRHNEFGISAHNSMNQPWFFDEGNSQIAHRPTNENQWHPWPNRESLPKSNVLSNQPTSSTAHIPSLLKITIPHPNEIRIMPDIPNQPDNTSMIDATKRKGLPAWIREGLEKMEREKQKQLEKEQQNKDIHSSDEDISNKDLVKSINSINDISSAALGEESTDTEEAVIIKRKTHTDMNLKKDNEEDDTYSCPEDKTYEQKLSELMIVVRRTLTELLLETTNEEISKVADETIKKFKSKASSAQVIRKSALSTLTGKLGLAAYGDSSSDNDSDNNERSNSSKKTSCQSESDNGSEEEIRNIIRLKRRAFIKISEEIEERVTSAAAREEDKVKYFSRKEEEEKELSRGKEERSLVRDTFTSGHSGHNSFKGYEKDFGEITETKIQQLNGKRQRERSSRRERITRFSDNKEKYVALPNPSTFLTGTNFGIGNNTIVSATSSQRKNVPDINGLLSNYTSTGMTNVLNAADAALEKVLKGKDLGNIEKQSRRHTRARSYKQSKKRRLSESKNSRSRSQSSSSSTSSSSSSTSSDSDTSSTSRSSYHSKYKHQSSKKHKTRTSSERHYDKPRKSHRSERKYSSSSYKKRDREPASSRKYRSESDSEDDYRRRHYSSNSSEKRSYTSSKRARDREHSQSQSRSYSSNSRRQ